MLRVAVLPFTLLALASGCGGSPTTGPGSPSPGVVTQEPGSDGEIDSALPAAPTLAAIDSGATLVAHLDGQLLRKTALYTAYRQLSRLIPGSADVLAGIQQQCGFDPLEAIRQVSIGAQFKGRGDPRDVVMALSLDAEPELARACADKLGAGRHGYVSALVGPVLLVGEPAAVARARERVERGGPASLPPAAARAISRHRAAALVVTADLGALPTSPVGAATLTLTSDAAHFSLRAILETDSASTAAALAAQMDPGKLSGLGGTETAEAVSALPRMTVIARGKLIEGEIRVDGDMAEQTRAVGALAAVAIHGVRRYLGRAKESEARATVRAISLALTRHLESMPAARRRMPASAPPTPAQVPRAQKSVVPESAWQHPTWKSIGFSIADPVYYSYQIITARGGRRATVRATGDLDGDGIESRYSLELVIDAAGKIVASPELVIDNPLE